jgi:predicted dehydrogenase
LFNFLREKYSFVVLGPGIMAEKHTKSFLNLGYKLNAVYSPKKIKNKFFSNFYYLDNLELLNNIDFDFAIITSPNKYHSEQINFLLEKNKILFVEKPLVTNLSELNFNNEKILKNVFVAFNLRYQKNSEYLRNLIKYKNISKIEFSWLRSQKIDLNSWHLNKTISGGGIFLDWGVHCLDIILFLLNFKNINLNRINALNWIKNIECAINAEFKIDNINFFLNLSWVEKENQSTCFADIYLEDGTKYTWHKSGEVFFSKERIKKRIFIKKSNTLYEYFINEYLSKKNIYKFTEEKSKNFKIYFDVQRVIADGYNKLNLR